MTKPALQDLCQEARIEPKPPSGRFIEAFSYSGPAVASVQQGAREGAKVYTDCDYVFTRLPDPLKDSDWVQTADADKLYSAVDLINLAVNADGVLYVAHDDRLPRPDWLKQQFKPTGFHLAVNGREMRIFERRIRTRESFTLGSNTEDRRLKSCNMYVVFVNHARLEPAAAATSALRIQTDHLEIGH